MTYADKDPEDVYDATDPVPVRLDVLEAIVADLERRADPFRHEARRVDALRLVDNLLGARGVSRRRLHKLRRRLEDL